MKDIARAYRPDDVLILEVTSEWLESMKEAIFKSPINGKWVKIQWIEPLIDTGRHRLIMTDIESEWIIPMMAGGNMFSRN